MVFISLIVVESVVILKNNVDDDDKSDMKFNTITPDIILYIQTIFTLILWSNQFMHSLSPEFFMHIIKVNMHKEIKSFLFCISRSE